ncbi:hypothetical protein [Brucella thiophenivorans]|uniref:Uncharacterized protein n=1 Tax=Brucella thiophenivorans TaxID=571255 RepID=A0A256FE31_9HYPH|nr:hypothetical protein [Brucella thiophenivorans]OYR13063.1 hypothetical protein CEV31_3532 [Brucella thiophenivorans]
MQENITDVALELADYARAAREAGKSTSADLNAVIDRLFQAEGEKPEDALAILAYAQLFLVALATLDDPDSDDGVLRGAFRCVHKAVTILEGSTGKKVSEYI